MLPLFSSNREQAQEEKENRKYPLEKLKHEDIKSDYVCPNVSFVKNGRDFRENFNI
jgi:hypothetical protein